VRTFFRISPYPAVSGIGTRFALSKYMNTRFTILAVLTAISLSTFHAGPAVGDDVETLIQTLGSPYQAERDAAREELLNHGAAAVEVLIRSLDSDNYFIRKISAELIERSAEKAHAEALSKKLPEYINKEPEVAVPLMNALARLRGKQAVPSLRAAVAGGGAEVRTGAVELLGELGDEESAKDIIALLRDGHSEVRSASARALAKIRAKDAGNEIFKALKDEKVPAAQIAFIEALGELSYAPADEFIIAIIRDETSPLFLPAVRALSKIGSGKARDALVDLLMKAEDFEMLDLAGSAVALISESAIPILNEKLKGASIDDRARILRAFSHMGPEAIPHIIRFMENEPYPFLQDRAAKALREMAKRLYDESIKWGPRYDDPPAEKREDIKRWKNWWAEKEKQ